MDKSRHEPECMLAHQLIDKLANIVGHCDLLGGDMGGEMRFAYRVNIIQKAARKLTAELVDHQRELSAECKTKKERQQHQVA
jgi:hypothetical protein